MKKIICIAAVLLAASIGNAAYPGTVLFSDSYNRPNATDIDVSSVGMAGPLAPLTYVEVFEGSGQATSIQVLNNQLNVAMGVGMSSLFLDHNFIDSSILSANGFSVSLNVTSITNADDQANRFGGFGVGNTRAQALAAGDSFDSAAPFRPSTTRADQGIGVSDFFVDLALDQNLRLWSNGALLETIAVGTAVGTIRVDFYAASFTAGSQVIADVYFNGIKRSTRSFAWDFTDANYLGISGRTAAAGVFLDNLSISTLYNNKANFPVPGAGETGVDPAAIVLQWNKGKDVNGNPNANIGQHYVYMAEGEPNFVDVSPITVPDSADPISYSAASIIGAEDLDKVYYWRVDESVNGSLPSEPNTIVGLEWSFETLKSVPIITSQPANVLTTTGQTAKFALSVTSISPAEYFWYRSADFANNTPDDDTLIGQAATLTLNNVQVSDEGYYYCKVTNSGGEDSARYSNIAQLGIQRKVAHWTLDAADYSDGHYVDISGEGHHAEPNLAPEASSFVPGVDAAKTDEGLDLTVEPLTAAEAGMWAPSAFTGEITVSAWVKWAGFNGQWQGVVSNRVTSVDGNFFIEIRQDNGNIQLSSPYFALGALQGPSLPIDQWTHLAVTANASGLVIYIDGLAAATRMPATAITQTSSPLFLGALNRSETGQMASPFNGIIDDVRLFNYAQDRYAVADLYYEVLEKPLCLNPEGVGLQFDVAGGGPNGDQPDCRVNLVDFAAFAQEWLNCGLYPQADCQP